MFDGIMYVEFGKKFVCDDANFITTWIDDALANGI